MVYGEHDQYLITLFTTTIPSYYHEFKPKLYGIHMIYLKMQCYCRYHHVGNHDSTNMVEFSFFFVVVRFLDFLDKYDDDNEDDLSSPCMGPISFFLMFSLIRINRLKILIFGKWQSFGTFDNEF